MPFANPAGIASDGGVWVYPKSAHPKIHNVGLDIKLRLFLLFLIL